MTDMFDDAFDAPARPVKSVVKKAAKPQKPPKERKPAVPPKWARGPEPKPLLPTASEDEFDPDAPMPDAASFRQPVGVTFLATVLGTEPRRLANKLAACPVVRYETRFGKQVALYDFKEAISYCVEPKIDMARWIKSQTTASLPPHISKGFWEAMNGKLRYERAAGELWHTSDVLEVFGVVFMTIKETTQLWIENLPGKATMSSEQYEALSIMVSEMHRDLHEKLVEIPKMRKTEAVVRDIDAEMAAGDAQALKDAAA